MGPATVYLFVMNNIIRSLILLLPLTVGACATMDNAVRHIQGEFHDAQGQYYLNKGDFASGRAAFAPRVAENPEDPELNYFMARFELGGDKPEAALPYIQKAVKLAPDNADYRFWEGVTWWTLMKPDKERSAYEKSLSIDPNHLSANLYLAHNMLDRGRNAEALKLYDKVLALNPDEPQAMFNRAVVLERLKRTGEMKLAMHRYLESYPDAPLARQGVRMLNKAGDFTWRNHPMGQRNVALRAVDFKPGTAELTEEAKASLNRVRDILSENTGLNLNVIAYVKGDESLARHRALAVQEHVSRKTFGVGCDRLTPRWFGQPETVKSDGRTQVLAESVNIFTKIQNP